ncbi:HAD-like domain-containing protein [Microdochium bolleyi]|uniref:HAD-like domain-containing protein n=1 Tax=Microdochium bolleyi TaxID=196109 RepID=A0A136IXB6_9PEZI|nr:HAD-like domain-containing protein [Microdochium bolleyi]
MFDVEHRSPTLPYNEVLVETITQLAKENNLSITDSFAEPFGNSPGTWGPFPDSIDALGRLKKHYSTLVLLSNIDNVNIRTTVDQRLEPIKFEAVYTAQDIGSYKPERRNFEYMAGHMRKELGLDYDKGDVLHVAHSLQADHVTCKKMGLRSVYIARGEDEASAVNKVGGRDKVGYEWKFETLNDFADEVERQFQAKQGAK